MKELKRISAFFMAMLMMLTVFSAFSVVSAEGEAAGGTQPVWPAQGSIKLDKDAAAVEVEGETNLWEVTLGIQGKNFETTSDVVLVIDCSGSMKGDKLANTRIAAKAFGQKLLTEGSTTRIAIVTFADTAAAHNNGHFYDATELSAFEAAVDAATSANGGTNQQAGIHKAQELLNTSSAGLKNIVILSDGEATYSYRISGTVSCTEEVLVEEGSLFSYDRYATSNVDWATANINCNYDSRDGDGIYGYFKKSSGLKILNTTQYYADKYITHGVATIWEANQAKAAGTTIYSVALQAGTNGENTLKACATNPTKDYFAIASSDNVEEKLTTAFQTIAGSIAIAARQGVVNDPHGRTCSAQLQRFRSRYHHRFGCLHRRQCGHLHQPGYGDI